MSIEDFEAALKSPLLAKFNCSTVTEVYTLPLHWVTKMWGKDLATFRKHTTKTDYKFSGCSLVLVDPNSIPVLESLAKRHHFKLLFDEVIMYGLDDHYSMGNVVKSGLLTASKLTNK